MYQKWTWRFCSAIKDFWNRKERVVRYLDREYGNKVRAKTLDGWKMRNLLTVLNF